MSSKNLYDILNIFYFSDHNDAEKHYEKALENYRKEKVLEKIKYDHLLDKLNNSTYNKNEILNQLKTLANNEQKNLNDINYAYQILSNEESKEEYDRKNQKHIIESFVIKAAKELKNLVDLNSELYSSIGITKIINKECYYLKLFYEYFITNFNDSIKTKKIKDEKSIAILLEDLINSINIEPLNINESININFITLDVQLTQHRKQLYKYVAECLSFIILYHKIYYELHYDPYQKEYRDIEVEICFEKNNYIDKIFFNLLEQIKEDYQKLEYDSETQKIK